MSGLRLRTLPARYLPRRLRHDSRVALSLAASGPEPDTTALAAVAWCSASARASNRMALSALPLLGLLFFAASALAATPGECGRAMLYQHQLRGAHANMHRKVPAASHPSVSETARTGPNIIPDQAKTNDSVSS